MSIVDRPDIPVTGRETDGRPGVGVQSAHRNVHSNFENRVAARTGNVVWFGNVTTVFVGQHGSPGTATQ